jgi:D-glycero-alpha-D-manno-heptose-7-phosphate kinase
MIIARSPLRISFFGGGTDFPEWYLKNSGEVISTTIDKYTYVLLRKLPPFFKFKYRLRYFENEFINNIDEIKHPTIKAILKNIHDDKSGLDISHNSDLPAQSGLGSSSAFTVALVQAMIGLNGKTINKYDLAEKSTQIEQNILGECVGSQDQFASSFGGFNSIKFNTNNRKIITPININQNRIKALLESSVLFFTGFSRTASTIESDKLKHLEKNHYQLEEINSITQEAKKILYSDSRNNKMISDLSLLLNETWQIKKRLSKKVTSDKIDEIFNVAKKNGALAGKLLGAGGGGFVLFLVKNRIDKTKLVKSLNKLKKVEFGFDTAGSQILYSKLD